MQHSGAPDCHENDNDKVPATLLTTFSPIQAARVGGGLAQISLLGMCAASNGIIFKHV